MQFSTLHHARGDSHLFVSLLQGSASYTLVDADYSRATAYVEEMVLPLPIPFPLDQIDTLLGNTLYAWSQEIGWDLVDCSNDICMLSHAEEDTVQGVSLIIDSAVEGANECSSTIFGANISEFTPQRELEAMPLLLDVLDVTHLIVVRLDWDEIKVFSVSRGREELLRSSSVVIREYCLDNDFLGRLAERIDPGILGVTLRRDGVIDMIANARDKKIFSVSSYEFQDVLRSYVMSALFSIREKSLRNFGIETSRGMVLITGEIARAMKESDSILSVIDGLQLRGRFELAVDCGLRTIPLSVSLIDRNFVFPVQVALPRRYLYLSMERGASGHGDKTAFKGRMVRYDENGNKGADESLIVGQCGHIHSFPIAGGGTVLLQPARDVYFPNLTRNRYENKEYLAAELTPAIDHVIVDCRRIPVRYGPDQQSNIRRIAQWSQGFPNVS